MNKINLDRFSEKRIVIVPIIKKQGTFSGRRFTANVEDGFYNIELGDYVVILGKADLLNVAEVFKKCPSLVGFLFGNEVVPESFNVAKTKIGLASSSINVTFFAEAEPWNYVEIAQWHDGNWFLVGRSMSAQPVLLDVKEAFENDKDLKGIKGVTPEMRYLYFLFSFERNAAREMERLQKLAIEESERKKLIEEFKRTVGGRLKESIEKAGGQLVRFSKYGKNRLEVIWTLGSEKFNSLINADTFQCVEAGFCVSHGDSALNIGGAVLTARDYMIGRDGTVEYAVLKSDDLKRYSNRSLIHKTRE